MDSSEKPKPSPKRRPTYTFQGGVRVEVKSPPLVSSRTSVVAEEFEIEDGFDEEEENFDNDPGPPRRPTKPSGVTKPVIASTKPPISSKPTLAKKPSLPTKPSAVNDVNDDGNDAPPPILGPKPPATEEQAPGPPLMIRGIAPPLKKKSPPPPPGSNVDVEEDDEATPPLVVRSSKVSLDVVDTVGADEPPPVVRITKPNGYQNVALGTPSPDATTDDVETDGDAADKSPPVIRDVKPHMSVNDNALPTPKTTLPALPPSLPVKGATLKGKSATLTSLTSERASFYEAYSDDGVEEATDKDGYERPTIAGEVQEQYETLNTTTTTITTTTTTTQGKTAPFDTHEDYEEPDVATKPSDGYEKAPGEQEQDDYETLDHDRDGDNDNHDDDTEDSADAPPMPPREIKPPSDDDVIANQPTGRREAPAPPPITSIPKKALPPPTEPDVEDVYEEINYKRKSTAEEPTPSSSSSSRGPPPPFGKLPPKKGGMPPEPIEAIYEAIDDVTAKKAQAQAPPPVPAPFKSKAPEDDVPLEEQQQQLQDEQQQQQQQQLQQQQQDQYPNQTQDQEQQMLNGDLTTSPASNNAKKRQSKRMSTPDNRPSWWPKATKSKANKKLLPMPKTYEASLTELNQDLIPLFETKTNCVCVPKYIGDLEFGPYTAMEVLEMDGCPAGKWIGRIGETVGFVATSAVFVDAGALKAMMMNQAPLTKKVSNLSAEGVPLDSHGARLGIRVADKAVSERVITRKSMPSDEAPPIPQPFASSGNTMKSMSNAGGDVSDNVNVNNVKVNVTEKENEYDAESTLQGGDDKPPSQTYEEMVDVNAPALSEIDKGLTMQSKLGTLQSKMGTLHYEASDDVDDVDDKPIIKGDYEQMNGPGIFAPGVAKSPYENEQLEPQQQDTSPYDNKRLKAHCNDDDITTTTTTATDNNKNSNDDSNNNNTANTTNSNNSNNKHNNNNNNNNNDEGRGGGGDVTRVTTDTTPTLQKLQQLSTSHLDVAHDRTESAVSRVTDVTDVTINMNPNYGDTLQRTREKYAESKVRSLEDNDEDEGGGGGGDKDEEEEFEEDDLYDTLEHH